MKKLSIVLICGAITTGCSDSFTGVTEPLPPLPRFDGFTQFVDSLEYGGYEWVVRVHLPRTYEHAEASRIPLFLVLHGSGDNAEQMQSHIGLDSLADARLFAAAYPNWLRPRKITAADIEPDVLAFTRFLVRDLAERYAIDLEQVVATGFSAGGMLAGRLACEPNSVTWGIAPVGATLARSAADVCEPSSGARPRPTPVLYSLGEDDNSVPPEGRGDLLSLDESAAVWRRVGSCGEKVSTDFTPTDPAASPRIFTSEWSGCAAGQVRTDLIAGAGHQWLRASQNTSGIDITEIVVDFLLEHLR